jgi:alkylation response protein AidB-like acyl-CoA dehydrogenase
MTLFLPTEEQRAMSRGIAGFLAEQYPLARFRASNTTDSEYWQDFARIGVLGISLPPTAGGMGLSWVDEILVCREAGRYLVSPALVGGILAAQVAARAGLPTLCAGLLAGGRRAGIAMARSSTEIRVIDGDPDLFLLVEPQRVRLVESGGNGRRALACIDETLHFCAAPLPVAELACVAGVYLVLAAQLLAAALLCGLLETTRDMAADYARQRVQFGRPIGAFQAIKHRCADIALAAELCWSQTLYAADALATGAGDAEFHVLTAKLLAGEEALKATRFNIQAHGAMGFTNEVDAHRLMKRAHVLDQLFGDPRAVRAKLVNLELDI